MKIVQLVSSLGIGGAERLVVDLSVNLSKNHQVYVLVLDNADDAGKDSDYEYNQVQWLEQNNVKVFFLGKNARKNIFKTFFRFKKLIKSIKPEIVHSHLFGFSCLASILIGFKFKHIFTQHTNILKNKQIHRFFLKYRISKYIAICNSAKDDFLKVLNEDRVDLIFNGIDIDKFPIKERMPLYKQNSVKFITISRLSEEKNHHLLLDAFNQLCVNHPEKNFTLTIVGDGDMYSSLLEKVSFYNINDRVLFLGTRNDISDLLSSHDVYLLPSKFEGLSVSLIEALSTGISIIASNVGGNSDIITDNRIGILVERDNVGDLYAALENVLLNNNENRNISLIKDHVHNFSIDNCTSKHIELYKRVI